MKKLIEFEAIVIRYENIDEKGYSHEYYLKTPIGEVSIRHCPGCGEQITRLALPKKKCEVDISVYHPEVDDPYQNPYQWYDGADCVGE